MEERGNKTIMCSVLFLDIAEYSKRSVAGQISLKERFNSYLSAAIKNVPTADRIILDTGDGAAINFLGDVEDALKAALSLRESMLNEDPNLDPPLLVRSGINLGPVCLVRDINGQPNIVGDGINVSQRIMGFAAAGQILVSRSYYDAVSRLSPEYAGMFHYQGSRTDKHVREHEVYAIGYPGGKMAGSQLVEGKAKLPVQILASVKAAWNSAASKLDGVTEGVVERFNQAGPRQRDLYITMVAIAPVLLVSVLVLKMVHTGKVPVLPGPGQVQAPSDIQPQSAVVPVVSAAPPIESKAATTGDTQVAVKPDTKKPVTGKPDTGTGIGVKPDSKGTGDQVKHPVAQSEAREPASTSKKTGPETAIKGGAEQGTEAYVSINCKEGTQLFVDGALKGKVVKRGLTVAVSPGKRTVIVTSASGSIIHSQSIELAPGRTAQIRPKFCD